MKLYPLVIKLEDKICSFIGGGNQIQKKICDILEYNPKIFLFAETINPSLQDLIETNKKIIWQKSVNYEILLKSHLVFISDEAIQQNGKTIPTISLNEIQAVMKFCKKYSKLICFLDHPKYCDFYNTHIYEKGPILISISTSGVAPVIGNYLKKQLDCIVNDDIILLTNFLSKYRSKIVHQINDYNKRKAFYEQLIHSDFIELLKKNEEEALGKLLQLMIEFR
ncbi:MAG: precorrin-2 dehydrogenase [Leptospiraceae bacterium]|nr:MAG: precorrin-2 dehydrogenase [Leptospiraceae bacterium]